MVADDGEGGGDEQSNNIPAKPTILAQEPKPGGQTTTLGRGDAISSHSSPYVCLV